MSTLEELHEKVLSVKKRQADEEALLNRERTLRWRPFLEDLAQLAQYVKDTTGEFVVPIPIKDIFGNTPCLIPEESPIGEAYVYEELSIKSWDNGQPVCCHILAPDQVSFESLEGEPVSELFKCNLTGIFYLLFDGWVFYKKETEAMVGQIMEDFLSEYEETEENHKETAAILEQIIMKDFLSEYEETEER